MFFAYLNDFPAVGSDFYIVISVDVVQLTGWKTTKAGRSLLSEIQNKIQKCMYVKFELLFLKPFYIMVELVKMSLFFFFFIFYYAKYYDPPLNTKPRSPVEDLLIIL